MKIQVDLFRINKDGTGELVVKLPELGIDGRVVCNPAASTIVFWEDFEDLLRANKIPLSDINTAVQKQLKTLGF